MLTKYSGNYKVETSVDFRRADGSPAALVALAAPHGTGKTSIREGIELALTSEVQTPSGTVPVTALGARGAFGARPVSVHVTGDKGHAGAVIQSRKLVPEGSGVYADAAVRKRMAVRQAFDERLLSGKLAGSAAELARAFTASFGSGSQSRVDGQPSVLDEAKLASDYGALAPALSETFRKVAAAAYSELVRAGAQPVEPDGTGGPSDSDILTKMQDIIASSQTKVQAQIRELRTGIDAQTAALETVRAHASTTALGPEVLPALQKRYAAALLWERAPVSDALIAQHESTLVALETELLAQRGKLSELATMLAQLEANSEKDIQAVMERSDLLTKEYDAVCARHNTDVTYAALREKCQTVANVIEVTQACLLIAQRMRDFAVRGSDAAKKCPITGRVTEPNEWAVAVTRCEARLAQAREAETRARTALTDYSAPMAKEKADYEARLAACGTELQALQSKLDTEKRALTQTQTDLTRGLSNIQRDILTTKTTINGLRERKRAMPADYEHSSTIAQTIKIIEAHALLAKDTATDALKIEQLQSQIERMKAISSFCTAAAQGLLARVEAQIIERLNAAAQRTRPSSAMDFVVAVERGTQGLIFGMRLRNPRVVDESAPDAWHFVPYDALSEYQRTVLSLLVAIETSMGLEKILLLDDELGALDDNAFVQLLDVLATMVSEGTLTQVILATHRVDLFDPLKGDGSVRWPNRDLWFVVMPQNTVRDRAEQKLVLNNGVKPTEASSDFVQSLFADVPTSVSAVDADVFADMF